MRNPAIAPLLIVLPLAACGGPQVDLEAERAALQARSEAVVAAESAMDIEAALTYWAEDAIVQPAGAPQMEGKEAIGALYQEYFGSGLLKEFSGEATNIEVSESGDLAYETGVNRMVLNGPEGDLLDVGKYLAVWEKIDGEWYVTALSFTSDTPEPVAVEGS